MDTRQFLAGSVAGCVGQCVGHPLDSIKVVMQTATNHHSPVVGQKPVAALGAYQSAVKMYQSRYGLRSFFRGLSLPLLTKSVEQCVAFGIRGAVEDFLTPGGVVASFDGRVSLLDGLYVADASTRAGLSGAAAGACTALLLTPVYLVKVQLQATTTVLQSTSTTAPVSLSGPIEAIKTTVNRLGWRGLYTGALPTFLGSSIGYGFRFATYDKTVTYVRENYLEGKENNDTAISPKTTKILSIVLGGGLAGMATWISHFPLDLVANQMMAGVVTRTTSRPPLGMLATFRDIYARHGLRGYVRGLGPCLLRAFPVNAAIFLSYEACMGSL